MTEPKVVKSFRLNKDVVDGIKKLKAHYSKELQVKVSEAMVIERLVNEKLAEIKGEGK